MPVDVLVIRSYFAERPDQPSRRSAPRAQLQINGPDREYMAGESMDLAAIQGLIERLEQVREELNVMLRTGGEGEPGQDPLHG